MPVPPYSTSMILRAGKSKEIYFPNIFGNKIKTVRYIKMKSSQELTVKFEVGDQVVDFPGAFPANVWVDIEEDISTLYLTNTSTSDATIYLYATAVGSTKQGPVYQTEIVPGTVGVK